MLSRCEKEQPLVDESLVKRKEMFLTAEQGCQDTVPKVCPGICPVQLIHSNMGKRWLGILYLQLIPKSFKIVKSKTEGDEV